MNIEQSRAAENSNRRPGRPATLKRALWVCLAILQVPPGSGRAQAPLRESVKSSPFLTEDRHVLPFSMVREYPLVSARINGVSGKLMFDTGNEQLLSVNDHKVPMPGGKVIGRGFYGGKQKFEIRQYPEAKEVTIGDLQPRDMPGVTGNDMAFMERLITPDLIGLLGYDFHAGYLLKLDYRAGRITFYRQSEARKASKDFLEGESIVAVLPFETRKLPNHPLVRVTIGGVPFLGAFDTGSIGPAYMGKETQAKLAEKGLVTRSVEKGGNYFDIGGIALTPDLTVSVAAVPVFNFPFPPAEPMGTTEPDIIALGHALLRQYKTVWDFGDKKMYLLKP